MFRRKSEGRTVVSRLAECVYNEGRLKRNLYVMWVRTLAESVVPIAGYILSDWHTVQSEVKWEGTGRLMC